MRRRTTVRTVAKLRAPLPSTAVRQLGDAHWELRIDAELKSPNRSIWGGRWALRAVREGWEHALLIAVARHGGMETVAGAQFLRTLSVFVNRARPERRRVVLTRLVPHARNFLKDDDNLRYAGKSLLDAMKRVEMISDDRREWLDLPSPTQAVSPTGIYTTVIELQRLAFVAPARSPKRRTAAGGLHELSNQQ